MKLRRLRVRNMKLLRDLDLEIPDDPRTGEPAQWTILVGRNGTAKSTILQAIALAASGVGIANVLSDNDVKAYHDRRLDPRPAVEIDACFALPALGRGLGLKPYPERPFPGWERGFAERLDVALRLPPGGTLFEGTYQLGRGLSKPLFAPPPANLLDRVRSEGRPWWFVAGYGTERTLAASTRVPSRPHAERLETLFSGSSNPLFGLGFADRQNFSKTFVTTFLRILKHVLVGASDATGVTPRISNLELRGAGGVSSRDLNEKDKFELDLPGSGGLKVPALALSHGYRSTIAWIADLIGQFLSDFVEDEQLIKRIKPESLTGLVLVDELDLYLHPEWQVGFIEALSAAFPNLQFIATTHSPLIVSRCRGAQIRLLEWDAQGSVGVRTFPGDPRLMNTAELYRRVFDMHYPPPTELARKLAQYTFMAEEPERTDEEEAALQRLHAELVGEGLASEMVPMVPRAPQGET